MIPPTPRSITAPARTLPTKHAQVAEANRLLREAGRPFRAHPYPKGKSGFRLLPTSTPYQML
jgi:hypothetical protein